MTTGRRESWRSTSRRPWERGHPCPRGEKSGEKNRGGDITSMRLRRSLFFVAPANPAGRPSRRQPGETVQALPGRPGRGAAVCPAPPSCPKLPQAAAPAAQSMLPCSLLPRIGRNCSASPNTLHLIILMRCSISWIEGEFGWFRRTGKPLIFRLTARGLRRPRLETTRSSRISSSTASWNAFLCRGGDSDKARELAADNPDGMQKRKPVGIFVGLQRRFVQ